MNDSALKSFCTWARTELIKGVEAQMVRYGITEPAPAPVGSETVNGLPLSPAEIEQRDELLRMQAEVGHEVLRDRAAYTWFNRIVAIRFMDACGWLPSRMRMLSRADGSHGSEAVENALDVEITTADTDRIAELKMAGLDEPLWRYLFVAQCEELADCLPGVFERVGGAMGLLLPQGLMMADSVVGKLNAVLTEEDWREGVTVLGWMYQYYNADVKDEFFKSKRKAAAADIAPATQLFTPEWIVRYMVENSLGRLWMLNNPGSSLRERMEYYIEPDAEHEDFIRISSPEEITLCDPACGSGHILVYAFELLFHMYEERGYREREIPELILTKNLAGMEIDSRAAQIAELALAMCAREHDRRFFRRGVRADVTVLSSIPLGEDELPGNKKLAEELSHLGEIGSLLNPSEDEIDELKAAAASCSDDLFASATKTKLESAVAICEKLSRRFICVVANPPYMGSSSFNPFMSKWVKKNYADVKSDLCTCFIERGFNLAKDRGYSAMVTMASWMFLSSFEAMRRRVLDSKSIVSMCYMGHMVMRIAFNTSATVFANCRTNSLGSYCRIEAKDLDAAGNPVSFSAGETEFYRRDAETFKQIPGTPIAYWLSEKYGHMFELGTMKSAYVSGGRLKTHDNEKYVRNWWEVPASLIGRLWMPLSNGGGFSRWSGMKYDVVNWSDEANDFYDQHGGLPKSGSIERKGICWGLITSGRCSFRVKDQGELFTSGAPTVFMSNQDSERALSIDLAFLNSSIASELLDAINPTLNTTVGDVLSLPMPPSSALDTEVVDYADQSVSIADADWDSLETSWDFKRHPLL